MTNLFFFACVLFWFCVFFSAPPPGILIKIHQKCFQQQCLTTLPPPLSSIKSGSSNLKGDEKLTDTVTLQWKDGQIQNRRRVQVLIYYFTQIIFLLFFLLMGMFTSQMEPSVALWAFADLRFCFPWWKRLGKKMISSLTTGATLMFGFDYERHWEIILMENECTNIFFYNTRLSQFELEQN